MKKAKKFCFRLSLKFKKIQKKLSFFSDFDNYIKIN
jgi:hypothetical protein